jgi:hypothetical protein
VVEFGEWLCMDVLKKIPHRHFVFSIPKILRRYFLYDRKLLADLSRCAWESLKAFLRDAVPEDDPVPGAVIAVQTFGDFLGFNPHCHILVTDGCFYGDGGMFRVAPPLELKKLEAIFRHKVLRMLMDKGKITQELIAMLSSWRHSGFNVFCGNRISPTDDTAMEQSGPLHHPGVLFPRADAVPRAGREGRLYGQGRQKDEDIPRSGMAGRHVLAYPEPG